MEINNQYILLVNWQTLEDHTEGFRKSEANKECKKLLHYFMNPSQKWNTIQQFKS
jgi:heme-degrading monooxygenase HmoA